ncbi:MAG: pilus assembly protein PilZ [Stappia sp.]|uniref:PilZ domain-containing protein n=1 Tax=Stappia sp. TaxID=1870903 RepID=UPI000C3CAA77|nr:PilZ domain-containing protein [Stappia sp.]MAA97661.1 pilus assembly protein PilZ [Stappia sp.]MBM20087.1 pilus assembly protein PilZ [Stappia sp.]MBM20723.1 pilus assembly protein PilZ [Stappia sp.]|tara:strand:- start:81 stop:356 length:276 start_codon:yes stop_codon:yes gene_type:complete
MSNLERRASPRHRTLKSGKIVLDNNISVYDCRIRNLSEQGALLKLPSTVGVPDTFLLQIVNEDISMKAHVRWRTATELGVQFDEPLDILHG